MGAESEVKPTVSEKAEVDYGPDVRFVRREGRVFIVVATAHVSLESADLVREVIERECPDRVCVELDERRYAALNEGERWEKLDLKAVIRQKQLATLLIGVVLSAYQKRLGGQIGVAPGTELLTAVHTAEERAVPVSFCDRDVRVTLGRAWRLTSFLRKWMLLGLIVESLFDRTEVSEETLRELRRGDSLSEMLNEFGQMMPSLKKVLIDERDAYLTEKILRQQGTRIVAVVGAGHAEGIGRALESGERTDLEPIDRVPPASVWGKVLGWGIPILILGAIAWLGWREGAAVAGDNALYWILANGIPSSIGAALAMGHPFTVISAFLAAPLTSLTPVIGAGYVTALVQTYVRPPLVQDFKCVADEVHQWRGWWHNRLLRIFLTFLLPSLGSIIGTWIGGYEILSNLF